MKKRDLKTEIYDAYKAETPDISLAIVDSCKSEMQDDPTEKPQDNNAVKKCVNYRVILKRLSAVAACLVLFAFGMIIGKTMNRGLDANIALDAEVFVYFDVNPSVEVRMDAGNKVVGCFAGNADAEAVLAGLKLDGVDMNTALTAIVGSMYVNGYLSENSNSILISVETSDEEKTTKLLNDITAKINSVFEKSEMECSIIAQSLRVDDDLKQRASENGISVGKMHLLDKMAEGFGGLSEKVIKKLSELSIRDLNLIYLQGMNNETRPTVDLVSGTVNLALSADEATNAVLKEMGKTIADVECYRTFFLPSRNGESKVVYAVVIMLYDDPSVYKYEVDCQTGEVVKMKDGHPHDHGAPDAPPPGKSDTEEPKDEKNPPDNGGDFTKDNV